ncbi:MAG: 50S ribosomal protein L25 [Bdellovibrio sp. CG12_big_fil_rev_8_21_14_0_65_39_13]|nr:MAG: 50S ribosomal protein L25 [Bdellovibrio sp. CG22_combo_CG10-13_8_21_14_all_39_27]PIQ61753.1 MAG: 50S ribosomal protein L25 [Bdellovibrio sp. CG12_big_fil_rev_8_21_14_0_65_39_13]PIR34901.1 MAG: 50S ribosomal protein L25 [Bdellovibrio sp. CG11_big_fil_rev_8_21_14_0_20_39_38]
MEMTLNAKKRNEGSKARQLIKEGWVPGCVYAKGMNHSIQIPLKDMKACLKAHAHIINLKIENVGTYMVGLEEIQKDTISHTVNHVSFHALNKNEKTTLDIEIELTGKSKGETSGAMMYHLLRSVTVKGYPQDIPDKITVDVASLDVGDVFHVSDIAKGYKFEFLSDDLEKVVAKCSFAKVVELPEAAPETTVVESIAPVEEAAQPQEEYKKAA